MNESSAPRFIVPSIAVGIDVVETVRVGRMARRWGERFLNRFLTPLEQKQCRFRTERIAALIAAKEATSKALGTGLKGVGWREIEVIHASTGKPDLRLHGRAEARAAALGWMATTVSLSHDAGVTIAVIVALGAPEEAR